MTDSIDQGSQDDHDACADACPDDDAPLSIATILASIRAHSQAERQALEGAGGDRENAMPAVPSPAPASLISLREQEKPSKRRSSTKIVSTERLHKDAGRGVSTPRKCSIKT